MKRLSLMTLVIAGSLQFVAAPSQATERNVFQSASLAVVQACTGKASQNETTANADEAGSKPKFARIAGLMRHFCKNRNSSTTEQLSDSVRGLSLGNLSGWGADTTEYDLSSAGHYEVSRGFGGIQAIPLTGSSFKLELKPTAATLKLSW